MNIVHYKKLRTLVAAIDRLLGQLKQKAYDDADTWIRVFRNKQTKNKSKETNQITCSNHQALLTNITLYYQQTEQFLQAYLQRMHHITTCSSQRNYPNVLQEKDTHPTRIFTLAKHGS